jgi:hypothetical protein
MTRLIAAATTALVAFVAFVWPAVAQEEPEPAPDVNATLIVKIASPPLVGPDGTPDESADARTARLATKLRELRAAELPPFALAVSPVLCDEASLLRTPSTNAFLRELRATAEGATVLVQPYADARLPGLGTKRVVRELSTGRATLEACLERRTSEVAYPPDLEIDADVAKALSSLAIDRAFSSRTAHFTASDVLFLPARERTTDALAGLAVTVDLAREEVTAIDALLSNEELRFGTIEEFVAFAEAPADVLSSSEPPPFLDDVERAEEALARFDSFVGDDNVLLRSFRTLAARVASSAEWDGRSAVARARATELVAAVREQEAHIGIHSEPVTFTARQGALPVTITNDATYPVEISIRVDSPKLDITDATQIVTIEPPGDTVTFEATARSTGTFPTHVEVTSIDGEITFDEAELVVRSTAANLSAVVLTAGGALFLIVWFAGRIRRRAVAHRS